MANTNYRRTLSASSIIGDSVKNAQGENLGNLKELMVDVERGQVAYAVLDFGGVLGVGNKLFAVPWQAFNVDEQDQKLTLNVDKDRLQNAEGFDKNDWPDTAELGLGQASSRLLRIHPLLGALNSFAVRRRDNGREASHDSLPFSYIFMRSCNVSVRCENRPD